MRRVRCVSPHGGAHHGLRADNEMPAREGYTGPLLLQPNEGGWVWNPLLGHVAVGDEADAPEAPEFICDGFHFVGAATGQGDVCAAAGDACWCGQHRDVQAEAPQVPPAPATRAPVMLPSPLADLTGKENG